MVRQVGSNKTLGSSTISDKSPDSSTKVDNKSSAPHGKHLGYFDSSSTARGAENSGCPETTDQSSSGPQPSTTGYGAENPEAINQFLSLFNQSLASCDVLLSLPLDKQGLDENSGHTADMNQSSSGPQPSTTGQIAENSGGPEDEIQFASSYKNLDFIESDDALLGSRSHTRRLAENSGGPEAMDQSSSQTSSTAEGAKNPKDALEAMGQLWLPSDNDTVHEVPFEALYGTLLPVGNSEDSLDCEGLQRILERNDISEVAKLLKDVKKLNNLLLLSSDAKRKKATDKLQELIHTYILKDVFDIELCSGMLLVESFKVLNKSVQDVKSSDIVKKVVRQINDNATSLIKLGHMYMYGRGVSQNLLGAIICFERARVLRVEIAATANTELGIIYMYGIGGATRNHEWAFSYFELAALGGNAKAMRYLGFMKMHLCTRYKADRNDNYKEAIKNYENAATNHNDIEAMIELGNIYKRGFDSIIAQDMDKSVRYFTMALACGSVKAAIELGTIFKWGAGSIHQNIIQSARYFQDAVKLENQGANTKLGIASTELGSILQWWNTDGSASKNIKQLVQLFKSGADNDNTDAMKGLATLYKWYNGYGDSSGAFMNLAVDYLHGAAKKFGDMEAVTELATIYKNGIGGIPPNSVEADTLFQLAANKLQKEAITERCITDLIYSLTRTTDNLGQEQIKATVKQLTMAANMGHRKAKAIVGIILKYGIGGITQDRQQANRLFMEAGGFDRVEQEFGPDLLWGLVRS